MTKSILVISAGIIHPTYHCRKNLKRLLLSFNSFRYRFSTHVNDLAELKKSDYAAVVLYLHRSGIAEEAMSALEDFVFNGGGLLAVHSASASFKENDRYFNLLGGMASHQAKVGGFRVMPESNETDIFSGIKGFSVIDELYTHRYKKDVTVQFTTDNKGKREPVVWTRELGKGRIAYCALGHCAPVLKHSRFGAIIQRSLHWVSRLN